MIHVAFEQPRKRERAWTMPEVAKPVWQKQDEQARENVSDEVAWSWSRGDLWSMMRTFEFVFVKWRVWNRGMIGSDLSFK